MEPYPVNALGQSTTSLQTQRWVKSTKLGVYTCRCLLKPGRIIDRLLPIVSKKQEKMHHRYDRSQQNEKIQHNKGHARMRMS
jgi:hypothetical protein